MSRYFKDPYGFKVISLISNKPVSFMAKPGALENSEIYEINCELTSDQIQISDTFCDELTQRLLRLTKHCVAKRANTKEPRNLSIKILHDLKPHPERFPWKVITKLPSDLTEEFVTLFQDPIKVSMRVTSLSAQIKEETPLTLGTFQDSGSGKWIFPEGPEEPYGFSRHPTGNFLPPGAPHFTPRKHRDVENKLNFKQKYKFSGLLTVDLSLWMTSAYTDFNCGVFRNPAHYPRPKDVPILETFLKKLPPDLTILVTKTSSKFKCHKEFLSSSSSYFAACFSGRWNNADVTSIELDDVSDVTVEALLQFVYSLDMEMPINCWPVAAELYLFANQYAFETLLGRLSTLFIAMKDSWFSDKHYLNEIIKLLKTTGLYTELREKLNEVMQRKWVEV